MTNGYVLHHTERIKIFDNQGKSFDRFTIVYTDGSFAAMSHNPLSPGGVWEHGFLPCLITRYDKPIKYRDLPPEVQKAIEFDKRKGG